MATQGKSSKIGTTKNKPSQVVYTQQMRWERNKRLRIEKEGTRQAWCKKARAKFPNRRDISRAVREMKRT